MNRIVNLEFYYNDYDFTFNITIYKNNKVMCKCLPLMMPNNAIVLTYDKKVLYNVLFLYNSVAYIIHTLQQGMPVSNSYFCKTNFYDEITKYFFNENEYKRLDELENRHRVIDVNYCLATDNTFHYHEGITAKNFENAVIHYLNNVTNIEVRLYSFNNILTSLNNSANVRINDFLIKVITAICLKSSTSLTENKLFNTCFIKLFIDQSKENIVNNLKFVAKIYNDNVKDKIIPLFSLAAFQQSITDEHFKIFEKLING